MKAIYLYFLTVACSLFALNSFAQDEPDQHNSSPRIIIAPNPVTSNFFTVENDSCTYDHFDRLVIYNSNGFIMQNKQLQMYKGSTKQQIDISGFTPGNYFIRIVDLKDPLFAFSTQIVVQ
jgi:hypothetical protein